METRHLLLLSALLGCGSVPAEAPDPRALQQRLPVVTEPTPSMVPPGREEPAHSAPAAAPFVCGDHQDCVLFCPEVPGCCGASCGCNQAVNRTYVAELTRDYARDCARPPDCPAVACQYKQASAAMCMQGRCVASGPGF